MKLNSRLPFVLSAATVALLSPLGTAQTGLDAQDQRATKQLESVLRRRVKSLSGPLQLKIVPTSRSDAGQFAEIYLAARPAQIKKLRFSELTLRSVNARVDVPLLFSERKLGTLASPAMRTSLRAVVTESDLTNLLAQGKRTKEMNLRVRYIGQTMRVTGNLNFGFLRGPVVGLGKMRLAPNKSVYLDILSMKLNGAEVPTFAKQRFSQQINPVITYEDLPFAPKFRSLKVVGNRAIITA